MTARRMRDWGSRAYFVAISLKKHKTKNCFSMAHMNNVYEQHRLKWRAYIHTYRKKVRNISSFNLIHLFFSSFQFAILFSLVLFFCSYVDDILCCTMMKSIKASNQKYLRKMEFFALAVHRTVGRLVRSNFYAVYR